MLIDDCLYGAFSDYRSCFATPGLPLTPSFADEDADSKWNIFSARFSCSFDDISSIIACLSSINSWTSWLFCSFSFPCCWRTTKTECWNIEGKKKEIWNTNQPFILFQTRWSVNFFHSLLFESLSVSYRCTKSYAGLASVERDVNMTTSSLSYCVIITLCSVWRENEIWRPKCDTSKSGQLSGLDKENRQKVN